MACATITNAPTPIGGCAIGFSNTFSFPVSLPFDLSSLGFTGCDLNQSNEIFGLPWTVSPGQDPQFAQAIPALTSALGVHLFVQAYAFAPGENPAQVVVSNGLDWQLGNY